jgi:hypothetical protein
MDLRFIALEVEYFTEWLWRAATRLGSRASACAPKFSPQGHGDGAVQFAVTRHRAPGQPRNLLSSKGGIEMIKKIMLVAFSLLVFGCLSWAADKSYNGLISDSHCGAKHTATSPDVASCVEKCISNGAKYVLVSHGKVYQLDAQDKFKGMGGKQVKVTGTLNGDTITVSTVAEATTHSKT